MTKEFERYSPRSGNRTRAEYPKTFNVILKGKRNLNTALALKIEKALDLEEGTLMILQVYYDIKEEKQKQSALIHPDFSIIRKILFLGY